MKVSSNFQISVSDQKILNAPISLRTIPWAVERMTRNQISVRVSTLHRPTKGPGATRLRDKFGRRRRRQFFCLQMKLP